MNENGKEQAIIKISINYIKIYYRKQNKYSVIVGIK